MLHVFPRQNRLLVLLLLGSLLLAACGTSSARLSNRALAIASANEVTIPEAQDLFTPFILTIQQGTRVTWLNSDKVPHSITTTWDTSTFLNPQPFSLSMPAHASTSFTFTQAGIYDYFDNTQARWDKADHRVSANKGVPNFPLAMEGVIWVQGHINGLPNNVTNDIPSGKDAFTHAFLAIAQGGSISWHNADTDTHLISAVTGAGSAINQAGIQEISIKGTNDMPGGETKTLTFAHPGLYYYYCAAHASVNTAWHRAQAHPDASEAPIPMDGFVLVE